MLTKAAEESVKFCLQRFGLDILLPALSTFGDTNNISANIAYIYQTMCTWDIQNMLNEKKFVVCYVWFGHSAAGTLHFRGHKYHVCKYFWSCCKLHNCFFHMTKEKKCCLLCLVWIIWAAEVCLFLKNSSEVDCFP